MKWVLYTIIIIVLIVLFGTWPLSILSIVFEYVGKAFHWLAETLDFFGLNGLL